MCQGTVYWRILRQFLQKLLIPFIRSINAHSIAYTPLLIVSPPQGVSYTRPGALTNDLRELTTNQISTKLAGTRLHFEHDQHTRELISARNTWVGNLGFYAQWTITVTSGRIKIRLYVTQVQQRRPESPTVLSHGMPVNTRYINSIRQCLWWSLCTLSEDTSGGIYVPCREHACQMRVTV